VPAYDRQAEIICTVKNLGYAKAEEELISILKIRENGVKLEALLLK